MKAHRALTRWILLATIGALTVACRPASDGWSRLVQSPSSPYLRFEVDRALDAVREGRAALPADPAAVGEAFDEAHAALSRVRAFYLPMLEATRRAYNAHQLAALGETARAQGELDHIEKLLVAVAGAGPMDVVREMEEPLDLLEEARVSLASGSPEAQARLEWLAERLELMLMKGGLVLE